MAKEDNNNEPKKKGVLKHKYRFSVYNDASYKQLWHIRLSGLEAVILVNVAIVTIVAFVIVMIAFTPLREFIPGYPDEKTRRDIVQNALRADSLEVMMYKWELQLSNLNLIISGKDPVPVTSPAGDSAVSGKSIISPYSKEDSLLRLAVERELSTSANSAQNKKATETNMHYFTPVKGVITDKFDTKSSHFAIDVVTAPNARISSALNGTVILAAWTNETGYVLQIQHRNNTISVYKHCAKLLKKQGDTVKAGEAVAIIGNSGELSTGPHLHFELWIDGVPVDPEQYITF